MATQNYGNLGLFTIISQEIREQMQIALSPLEAFTFDAGKGAGTIFSDAGSTVTTHLYLNASSPAVQVVSGGVAINYALANTQSAVNLTPVPVVLAYYQSEGFTVPKLLQANSPAKDLVRKLGSKKIWSMAKTVINNIATAINGTNFTTSISMSGDGYAVAGSSNYTWAQHQYVIGQARLAGFAPSETSVTLSSPQFSNLVASLPVLPGVNVDEVLYSGFVDHLGGAKVYRSDTSLRGTAFGYISTPNAIAIAWRILPVAEDSYGFMKAVTPVEDEFGLALRVRQWTDPSAPNPTIAFDCIYGYQFFDPSALIILNP